MINRLKYWSIEDKEKLRSLYPNMSNVVLGELFGLSYKTIGCYANVLGLKKNRKIPVGRTVSSNRYMIKLKSAWNNIRAPLNQSEEIGKQWLLNNGFNYVHWFAEHRDTKGWFRRHFAFDYYAERNGDSWFIDATINLYKRLDPVLLTVFLRFTRVGVLFVAKERCFFYEIKNSRRIVKISLRTLLSKSDWMPERFIQNYPRKRISEVTQVKAVPESVCGFKFCKQHQMYDFGQCVHCRPNKDGTYTLYKGHYRTDREKAWSKGACDMIIPIAIRDGNFVPLRFKTLEEAAARAKQRNFGEPEYHGRK